MKNRKLSSVLRYVILIVVFLLAFFLIKWFYANLKTAVYEAPVAPVEVVKAEEKTLSNSIVITG